MIPRFVRIMEVGLSNVKIFWKKGSVPNLGQQLNVPKLVMLAMKMKTMKVKFVKIILGLSIVKIFWRMDIVLDLGLLQNVPKLVDYVEMMMMVSTILIDFWLSITYITALISPIFWFQTFQNQFCGAFKLDNHMALWRDPESKTAHFQNFSKNIGK